MDKIKIFDCFAARFDNHYEILVNFYFLHIWVSLTFYSWSLLENYSSFMLLSNLFGSIYLSGSKSSSSFMLLSNPLFLIILLLQLSLPYQCNMPQRHMFLITSLPCLFRKLLLLLQLFMLPSFHRYWIKL